MASNEATVTSLKQDTGIPSKNSESQSTVLPSQVASWISFGTATAALGLRIAAFVTSAALGGARITTLTSFELSRAIIEGVLARAGHDVINTSIGPMGAFTAETLLDKAVSRSCSSLCGIYN